MSLRVAVYARYSNDSQNEASIEDQLRLCRQRVEQEGWQLEQIYRDAAISGASTFRPGYKAMLAAAKEGGLTLCSPRRSTACPAIRKILSDYSSGSASPASRSSPWRKARLPNCISG